VRGAVINLQKTTENIKKVVHAVKEKTGEDFKEVFVGIAGDHIRTIKSSEYLNFEEAHIITKEDITELEKNIKKIHLDTGQEVLEIIPQDYNIDNNRGLTDPVGIYGSRLEGNYHIVTGRTQSINVINKCVENAGLKVKQLILEPLASAYATLSEEEKEGGVIMIDIGGGTSDIAVFKNHKLVNTAVIPFGGESITGDLVKILKILHRQAEEIKVKYASCLPIMEAEEIVKIAGIEGRSTKKIHLKEIANIINARISEIFKFILTELKETKVDLDEIGVGIVLTGGGSQLKYINKLVELLTTKEVRIGTPLINDAEVINKPQYSTAVGLVMAGSKYLEKNDENLIISKESENTEEETTNETKQKKPNIFNKLTEIIIGNKDDQDF
ncbi:MAG: cell division protein FtsA, partial [Bacteroidales bacterium]|nr:cell division protein FtsA [Bacteroidales bacterium]